MLIEIPDKVTKKWLASLDNDRLSIVVRVLGEQSANYQDYGHARTLSAQWERAFDELQRRLLIGERSSPQGNLGKKFINQETRKVFTVFGYDTLLKDKLWNVYAATKEGEVVCLDWVHFIASHVAI